MSLGKHMCTLCPHRWSSVCFCRSVLDRSSYWWLSVLLFVSAGVWRVCLESWLMSGSSKTCDSLNTMNVLLVFMLSLIGVWRSYGSCRCVWIEEKFKNALWTAHVSLCLHRSSTLVPDPHQQTLTWSPAVGGLGGLNPEYIDNRRNEKASELYGLGSQCRQPVWAEGRNELPTEEKGFYFQVKNIPLFKSSWVSVTLEK